MLREILARFGIQVDGAPLARASGMINGAIGQLRMLGGLLAGAFIVRAMRNFVTEMISLGDTVAKTAKQIGVSTDDLQAWEFAAERSGAGAGSLVKGLRRLQKNLVDAGAGLSTAVRAFDRLDVAWQDSEGNARQIADVLPDLADRFASMESATERSATAQELFGRAGNELLPLLVEGSAGIDELRRRFEELGGGLSTTFLQRAEAAQDAMSDFDLAMRGFKSTIAVDVLPTITRMTTKIADWIADVREATEGTRFWEIAMIGLGATAAAVGIFLLIAFAKPIIIILALAAALTVAVLLVQDFLVFMEGGESVIGKFFDAIGIGEGNARVFFQNMARTAAWFFTELLPAMIRVGIGWFKLFVANWQNILNIFATSIRGPFALVATGIIKLAQTISTTISGILVTFMSAVQTMRNAWTNFVGLVQTPIEAAGAAGSFVQGAIDFVTGGGDTGPTVAPASRSVNVETTNQVSIDARGATNPDDIERAARRAVDEANQSALRNAQRALTPAVE